MNDEIKNEEQGSVKDNIKSAKRSMIIWAWVSFLLFIFVIFFIIYLLDPYIIWVLFFDPFLSLWHFPHF